VDVGQREPGHYDQRSKYTNHAAASSVTLEVWPANFV
jgi:hypothetical protein